MPFDVRFDARPGTGFEKTWDLLEAIRADGRFVAIGPDEFERRAGAADDAFRETTLILAANRLGLSPDNLLVLSSWATERVQRTHTIVEGEQGGLARVGRGQDSTVIAHLEVTHPGTRTVVLVGRLEEREDPFAELPDSDPRPALTRVWRRLITLVLDALATRARGADPPRPWGFEVQANPRRVLDFDPDIEGLDFLEQEVATDRRLRYFHPTLDGRQRRTVMATPPGSLLVTALKPGPEARPPEGLLPGDVILGADGVPLMGAWQLDRSLRFSGEHPQIELNVRRKGEELTISWHL